MPTDAKYASAQFSAFAFGTAVVGVQYKDFSDSGVGSDAPSIEAQLSLSDSGVGSEYAVAGFFVDISDSGVGFDMIAQLQASVPIGDSGVGAETPSLQASLPISDSGVGSDILSALQAQLSVLESGIGSDDWTKTEVGIFAGIIRSTLEMLERTMKFEFGGEAAGFSGGGFHGQGFNTTSIFSMKLELVERKMQMELIE